MNQATIPKVEEIRDVIDLTEAAVILPIRHHSPACAFHVRKVIEEIKPDVVAIEGPSDANHLINELTDMETIPPVAIYGSLRSEEGEGRAHFYPFCEYSPELVGLLTAKKIEASSCFIDLPSWWMGSLDTHAPQKVNMYSDGGLRHDKYISELCQRAGCRDFDELWDVLFESPGFTQSSEQFFTSLATYCLSVRHHFSQEREENEMLTLRDAHMAARIRDYLSQGKRVVAIVGGRHRDGIRRNLLEKTPEPKTPKPPKEKLRGIYLTRYGYAELDSWSGYQSGMPAPSFYADVWKFRSDELLAAESNSTEVTSRKRTRQRKVDLDQSETPHHLGQVRLLERASRYCRMKGFSVSTSDMMAAAASLEGIRRLRRHPYPTLADLRDAIRSTWLKGHEDSGDSSLMSAVEKALVGSKVGRVTSRASHIPIIEDFYRQVSEFRWLNIADRVKAAARREVNLDIYRSGGHRQRSAFLHRLVELGCPYAKFESGPDFVNGEDLKRVRETWVLRWKPSVEASLVEAAVHGFSVEEAAANHLTRRAAADLHKGSSVAVEHLTSAMVMDFASLTDDFIDATRRAISREGVFSEAAQAMAGLVQLVHYRMLLGAFRHAEIVDLIPAAYQRAVWLIETLPGLPLVAAPSSSGMIAPSPVDQAVNGLILLRHAAIVREKEGIDPELLFDAIERVRPMFGSHPSLEGATLGILSQAGRSHHEDLARALDNVLSNTVSGSDLPLGEFLRGLFSVRRHAITEEEGFFEAIHQCLTSLEEERFLRVLPSLRLAFTLFTPREIRRIVELVEQSYRPKESLAVVTEQPSKLAGEVNETVRRTLEQWGWNRRAPT
ncbi:hypothetical protein K2Y11_00265 [bacterium]|nr:hypothetical protein [bacterium]